MPQVFVGGLDSSVKDQDLRQIFGQYGDLVSVKIPVGKGCGFVQFVNRFVPKLPFLCFDDLVVCILCT